MQSLLFTLLIFRQFVHTVKPNKRLRLHYLAHTKKNDASSIQCPRARFRTLHVEACSLSDEWIISRQQCWRRSPPSVCAKSHISALKSSILLEKSPANEGPILLDKFPANEGRVSNHYFFLYISCVRYYCVFPSATAGCVTEGFFESPLSWELEFRTVLHEVRIGSDSRCTYPCMYACMHVYGVEMCVSSGSRKLESCSVLREVQVG